MKLINHDNLIKPNFLYRKGKEYGYIQPITIEYCIPQHNATINHFTKIPSDSLLRSNFDDMKFCITQKEITLEEQTYKINKLGVLHTEYEQDIPILKQNAKSLELLKELRDLYELKNGIALPEYIIDRIAVSIIVDRIVLYRIYEYKLLYFTISNNIVHQIPQSAIKKHLMDY